MEIVGLSLCLQVALLCCAAATTETGSAPTPARDHSTQTGTKGRLGWNLSIILGVIGAVALLVSGLLYCKRKLQFKCRFKRMLIHQFHTVMFTYKCTFKYHFLESATGNFEDANKLGQGAFGSVYKGILDGREVAIKRLLFNRKQGIDDFYNEVNLLSSVRHKNLVKLIGCSAEGPERLIVYEYLPNNSLDKFLFGSMHAGLLFKVSWIEFSRKLAPWVNRLLYFETDKNSNSKLLDWRRKFDIIVGIAEGLAYLHEESDMRIIHRDIKASNILLDEIFTPKIGDFGLAKFFAEDQSHIFAGVAGTLGYIAPEYALEGQLTEKVDVFSFGVLVLEIVSGRKNTYSIPTADMQYLLQIIWTHYESETLIPEIIDPNLQEKEEALRVVHVALLCAQASATLRPPMSEVVVMLTNSKPNLPLPTQPAYINHPKAFQKANRTSASSSVSSNDITISVLEPR